jgi:hypothetical protein
MEKRRKVIIRTDSAGVHYGTLVSCKENNSGHYAVTLESARRIWKWSGANCLSELATLGSSDHSSCNFSIPVSSIKLMAIEVIGVTEVAARNIESVPNWVTVKTQVA